jgi:hypothetical protein
MLCRIPPGLLIAIDCYVTGNGLKAVEALKDTPPNPPIIEPRLEALEGLLEAPA